MKKSYKAGRKINSNSADLASVRELIGDAAWQPWLLPKKVSQRIVPLIPPGYRKRFRFYFDQFGCMSCKRKHIPYRSLGFCEICHSDIALRMRRIIKRHRKELAVDRASPRVRWYLEQIDRAQELLADFLPSGGKAHNPSAVSGRGLRKS